jgi:Ankyrin repeats (3 copies)
MSENVELIVNALQREDWELAQTRLQRLNSCDLHWQDESGRSVLEHALENEAPNYIVETIGKRIKTSLAPSSLHLTVTKRRQSMLKLLLEFGFDPNRVDSYGDTPLVAAIRNHSSFESILLLLKYGADPNLKTPYHLFPLMTAVENNVGNAIVLLLLRFGADPSLTGNDELSCVEFARQNKCYSMLHVMQGTQVLLVLAAASILKRVRRRAFIGTLPLDLLRRLHGFL